MAETKIEWADFTFNPWRGCVRVSEGCRNCYAETTSKRNPAVLGEWGPNGTRAMAAESYWRQPFKWNREAATAGERRRVFCASLADWLEDRPELIPARARLLQVAGMLSNLDWLFLSKRVDGWRDRMSEVVEYWKKQHSMELCAEELQGWTDGEILPSNFWIGASVENQETADKRVPELLKIPAAVRFLICEPLLGEIDLNHVDDGYGKGLTFDALSAKLGIGYGINNQYARRVDWVIVGGESGPNARPMNTDHLISLRDQCVAAGVPVFIKQMGSRVAQKFGCRDPKGGDMDEWPAECRIRQFPEAA